MVSLVRWACLFERCCLIHHGVKVCCPQNLEHKGSTLLRRNKQFRANGKPLASPITMTVLAGKWMEEVRFCCFAGYWWCKQVAGYSKFGLRWKHFKQTKLSQTLLREVFRDVDVKVQISTGKRILGGVFQSYSWQNTLENELCLLNLVWNGLCSPFPPTPKLTEEGEL